MKRVLLAIFALSVLASAQDVLRPEWTNNSSFGTISQANTGCAKGTVCVWLVAPVLTPSLDVTITGTFSGTLQFEAARDGKIWTTAVATTGETTETAPATLTFNLGPSRFFRVRASAWTSGIAKVSLVANPYVGVTVPGGGGGGSNFLIAVPNAAIAICNDPVVGGISTPCTNLASTYTTESQTTACPTNAQIVLAGTTTCVAATDSKGKWGFWAAPGQYWYSVTFGGVTYGPFPITVTIPPPLDACTQVSNLPSGEVNATCYAGADMGAKINAAIVALGPGCGVINVPIGSYSFATPIMADDTIGCVIQAGTLVGGPSTNKYIQYTGTASPIISAKSSTGFKVRGLNILATNPSFSGKCMDFTHSGSGGDAFAMEVSDNTCFASGGGLMSIAIDLDKAIVGTIKNNNIQHAAIGIQGASGNSSYSTTMTISGNHFGSSGGCMSTAMISNPGNAWTIEGNAFEMGTACGIPKVIACTAPTPAAGVAFVGNWIGDWGTGSTGTDIQICGTGWTVAGNFIGTPVPSPATVFDIANGTQGVQIIGNSFASGTAISTLLNVGISVKDLNFSGNGNLNAVTTLLAGTPVSGAITDFAGTTTVYGTLNTATGFTGLFSGQFNSTTATNIPVTIGGSGAYWAGGFGSPTTGRVYIGDGSGWQLEFDKRISSVDTNVFKILDNGYVDVLNGYKVGGAFGLTTTQTVKGSGGSNCDLTFTGGLLTASTCP